VRCPTGRDVRAPAAHVAEPDVEHAERLQVASVGERAAIHRLEPYAPGQSAHRILGAGFVARVEDLRQEIGAKPLGLRV